jgi:hypothetical protein
MKRLAYFVLLGPFLLCVAFMLIVMPDVLRRDGLSYYWLLIVPAYILGFIPMLALAGLDHLLSKIHLMMRALACAAVGCVIALVVFYLAADRLGLQERDFFDRMIQLGLFGAIPVAVCSLLTAERE